MRLRIPCSSGCQSLILLTSLFHYNSLVSARRDGPSIKSTTVPHVPYNLQYFEDSDVVLYEDEIERNVYYSEDAGETWQPAKGVPKGDMLELSMHPFDNQRAYIITTDRIHWKTKNRGKTWTKFYTDAQPTLFREALAFHSGDSDRILFNAMDCTGIFCEELTMYTTNGFSSDAKFLREETNGCHWAKSSELFTTGQEDLDDDRILCVVKGSYSPWRKDYKLLISDSYFTSNKGDIQEFEPELDSGRTVKGIVNMAVVKKYLITAASAQGTDEMALYVSDDAIKWHRAEFPHDHRLTQEAYTVLEGTNYSIQIDVMNTRPMNPMGVFLSSNSNGTYFTRNIEHTNRVPNGLVDFEKMSGIQGIVLVNTVQNWQQVEKSNDDKEIKSQISFDDGRTWQPLEAPNGDELHLHSVTELSNVGKVFSSPAPGLVMGNGNTGTHLKPLHDANMYVSDDAGLTWRLGLEGPQKYEFGDQGSVLVAVREGGPTDVIRYSLNHGQTWDKAPLPQRIRALELTTTQDSKSLKFILVAYDDDNDVGEDTNSYIITLDFGGMRKRQCTETDMEEWHARVDEDGKPTCLMGHTQSYRRRKADADCFLNKDSENSQVITKRCDCVDADFECDYNFVRTNDRKECRRAGSLILPDGACEAFGADDTFMGSSGWRLIPGNDCKRVGRDQKDDPIPRKCTEAMGSPRTGEIEHKQKTFEGSNFPSKHYLERTGISSGDDETILMRTDAGAVWLTHDHGKKWEEILGDQEIVQIYTHQYFNDVVFFLTQSSTVYYSVDRGDHIQSFEAPLPPHPRCSAMNFHPKNKDWVIWTGGMDCEGKSGDCHCVSSVTLDRGDHWQTLQRYVKKCEFIKEADERLRVKQDQEHVDQLIYCERKERENNNDNNPYQLVSSYDFFKGTPKVHFTNVVDFATMSEFIVVATKDEEHQTLKVDTSVDAETFAGANFPHGFEIDHQRAYTVLDSSTHSVFLHVTVVDDGGYEYGTIIKSNSNGTSYVLSANAVDRDTNGYVDFEKMFSLEGVAMINVVSNYNSKSYKEDGKRLKTMITHNDGAEWDYLTPPAKNGGGKRYCKGSLEKCSLNIHGYTERADKSHTFSSASAIGIMMGVGNVGEHLTSYEEADTFMTSDGGVSWKFVKTSPYIWAFGDQGSIIVIVKETSATNIVYYTLNEGESWLEYKFSQFDMDIVDLTTVPSDNAQNFLLWAKSDGQLSTINLDFSGLRDTPCELDEERPEKGDYYLWKPRHPKQHDDCLFGHVAQYHRKKTSANCYNGRIVPHLHNIARNCSCTRQDFECGFNYERQPDGTCALVKGLSPPDHSEICDVDSNAIEYYEPTGYRRIPISTCQGGKEMDVLHPRPCPGHEDEFRKKHAPSGWGIFFAIIVPIVVAVGAGGWVWRNWNGKWGQIRLGEQSKFDQEAPYIKYPVLFIAGLIAFVQATPLLLASLWRTATSTYSRVTGGEGLRTFTTRDSFARGRTDYANVVDEDDGELLGDDSDEEV